MHRSDPCPSANDPLNPDLLQVDSPMAVDRRTYSGGGPATRRSLGFPVAPIGVWLIGGWWGLASPSLPTVSADPPPAASRESVLVEVNGQALGETEFQRFCRLNGIPVERQRAERPSLLSLWIERLLVEQHLAKREITPNPVEVERVVQHLLATADQDPQIAEQKLAREFGSLAELRREFTFRLAWRRLVETQDEGRAWRRYYEAHRDWYDGTRLRARQIFLKVPADDLAGRDQAIARLRDVRERVQRGEVEFATVARELSQAPSRDSGGDLGWFPRTGTLPESLAGPAFEQTVGGMTEPIVRNQGVHLLQVTDREAGTLSLEDARERVLSAYGRQLWEELLPELRRKARIKPASLAAAPSARPGDTDAPSGGKSPAGPPAIPTPKSQGRPRKPQPPARSS